MICTALAEHYGDLAKVGLVIAMVWRVDDGASNGRDLSLIGR